MADKNPFFLFQELGGRLSNRKRLLFVIACWRDVWELIPSQNSREAVEQLEKQAETGACESELVLTQMEVEAGLWDRVWNQQGSFQSQPPWNEATAVAAATILVTSAAMESPSDSGHARAEAERARAHAEGLGLSQVWDSRVARYAAIFRHLVGGADSIASPAHWPLEILRLANALYEGESCSFALHDALLEAGHSDLAGHFGEAEAEHPKGCWALDLILSRK